MAEQTSPAQMIATEVQKRLPTLAREMAQKMGGKPLDADSIPEAEAARLWNVEQPGYDPAQFQALLAAGRAAEAVSYRWPWRNVLVGPGSPTTRVERAEALAEAAAKLAMQQTLEVPEGG